DPDEGRVDRGRGVRRRTGRPCEGVPMSGFLPPVLWVALLALSRNVTRSGLTTLGIVIGVGAVIAMVEIGQGSKRAVAESIQSLGANNLLLMPGQAASGGVSFGGGSAPTLTPDDAEAIAREVPAAAAVAPVVRA